MGLVIDGHNVNGLALGGQSFYSAIFNGDSVTINGKKYTQGASVNPKIYNFKVSSSDIGLNGNSYYISVSKNYLPDLTGKTISLGLVWGHLFTLGSMTLPFVYPATYPGATLAYKINSFSDTEYTDQYIDSLTINEGYDNSYHVSSPAFDANNSGEYELRNIPNQYNGFVSLTVIVFGGKLDT